MQGFVRRWVSILESESDILDRRKVDLGHCDDLVGEDPSMDPARYLIGVRTRKRTRSGVLNDL